MIKLEKSIDYFKILMEECKKGNNYFLSVCPSSENKKICQINTLSLNDTCCTFIRDGFGFFGSEKIINETCKYLGLNWENWEFYLLTSEEAAPYFKEFIVNNLEKQNEK